ncbi:hypothetical protein KL921_002055 [Ogataea angusta]|uniref:Uncharacterized protein n=1 Tax=Pichia angusta TaxID=870730 RepID=A0AAN6I778_PICAN|nr:uncharacterized protein KL928_002238 [Ogataea angusta]KAG7811789.1 hypothetical protein KL921_002055 [Ogataea angusta]KAG7819564.1 hypothetical protein KL928_002238 [Ogataea angusta]KAG7835084.1 hypothetical protein KL943_002399 [Ogataea angusta]KAG7840492.1 hypothetical protein KL942_002443 [Ogataea angusta]KAG7850400.1 hypothetical protein KL940_001960 [Ogataea angusta]
MSVEQLLKSITESIELTSSSLDNVVAYLEDSEKVPELVQSLAKESESTQEIEGVSLLSLKNNSMLSYINNLLVILGSRISLMKDGDTEMFDNAVKNSIVQRVALDRGVKPLEKKLNYQLDKLVSAYQRREKEQNDASEKVQEMVNNNASEDSENSEDEDEGLNYRPDASAFMKKDSKQETSEKDEDDGKYRPPKIAAALPPQTFSESDTTQKRRRNLQSMDEYLEELSEAPAVETSIGSTIVDKGRDMKTRRQLEKEAEIQRYEEENFTRLPASQLKMSAKEKRKKKQNEFFGEDWSMFDNSRDVTTEKKRKRLSAWERAKRRKD